MVKIKTNSKIKKTAKPKKVVKKKSTKKIPKKEQPQKPKEKKIYFETVGRRKTAVARVRLFTSSPSQSVMEGNLVINNDKKYKEFFPTLELQRIIEAPLERLKSLNRFRATVKVKGGGTRGQAEAICHGLARALVLFDPNFRKKLKKVGYLTRDSRKKERKKYGLKKARRAPQWSKR
jgi:small subunit ribosomal protein S9